MRRLIVIFVALCACSCMRRSLIDRECAETLRGALLNVSVDWSASGIDATSDSEDADYVHRVSFRFFPLDGAAPFDRFLENNITDGAIYVPFGEYSVVVFNESIDDPYWSDAIEFENCDDYNLFAARLVDDDAERYSFFDFEDGDRLSQEALKLASARIDHFVVTSAMSAASDEPQTDEDIEMLSLVNHIALRPLTCTTTISAEVENLSSAYIVHASLEGLAHRVFMASGDTDEFSTAHVARLTERSWSSDDASDGVLSQKRLTFSAPQNSAKHTLKLDVILVDGARYEPDEPMIYDVTDQIMAPLTRYADDDLSAKVTLSLPEVSGDIEVEGWGDDEQITIL